MKKLFVLVLVFGLMVTVSAAALGAVHDLFGDFTSAFGNPQFTGLSFEGWYSVDKDSPYVTARALNSSLGGGIGSAGFHAAAPGPIFSSDYTNFGLEYYQNDQFFVDLSDVDCGPLPLIGLPFPFVATTLKASYLFDFGLFVGLDYTTNQIFDGTIVSPGYRLALGEDGYIAVSADYYTGDAFFARFKDGIQCYDIDFKYFTDTMKLYGQVIVPNQDVSGFDATVYSINGNFKVADNVVLGASYAGQDNAYQYNVGATCSFDKLGLELAYTNNDYDSPTIGLNVLYSFTDKIRAGFQYENQDQYSDPFYFVKVKYAINDTSAIRLVYRLENESAFPFGSEPAIMLRWDMNL